MAQQHTRVKERAGIDFDDVVAQFNWAFHHAHNEWYDTRVRYDDIITHDLGTVYGASHEKMIERIRRFCDKRHDHIMPVARAVETLAKLADDYQLHIVTSRCETLRPQTEAWLHRHGVVGIEQLHFTNEMGFTDAPKRNKLEVCREIGARFLIDDAPTNALRVAGGGIPVILLDKTWNQDVRHPLVRRAFDWPDALELIKNLPK
jgi:uncharacterized HAD superfamily protein